MKLQLKWSTKSKFITQKFGNKLDVYTQQGMLGHNGVDIMTNHGDPVYASHDGMAYYQIDSGGGHGVVVITDGLYEYDNGEARMKTIYWHMVDPIKEPQYKSPIQDFPWGKQVKQGDLIGYSDSTGMSTGDHLHWALKPVATYGESNNSFYNLEQKNGYFGCIDPMPFVDVATGNINPFNKDLRLGMVHPDVKRLQQWLNSHDYPVALSGVGSMGHETQTFGNLTKQALIMFQKANNIEPSVGYFGSITRNKINNI